MFKILNLLRRIFLRRKLFDISNNNITIKTILLKWSVHDYTEFIKFTKRNF
jgi:hypothetical protein